MVETMGRTVGQVRELVGWVGAGRRLTQTGRVMLADARALLDVLDTGDRMDPVIGDRTFKTKSSEELYHLTLLVEWAKAARLLRTAGGRLLPVKKNAKLLDRPDELRGALFAALPHIGQAVTVSGWLESLFSHEYHRGLRTLLHRLYAATVPVPLSDLYEVVWQAISPLYVLDDLPPDRLKHLHVANDHDVQRVLKALASLATVHLTENTVELTAAGRNEMARMLGEPSPGDPVLRILVELADVDEPLVWRRLMVPAATRLDRLHSVIQASMGWQNCHMHEFTIDGVQYGQPHSELGFRDERTATLAALLKPGDRCVYTYDFGDSWEHRITVEQPLTAEAGLSYPHCVDGTGACPPEDCGGAPGYGDLKQILTDSEHEEHDTMLAWLGLRSAAGFTPDRFTPDEANARLLHLTMP
ncbi:plasmid pRiA4b ORF-3 family protein [Streptomyces sp. H27-D2]|uniref:plasmid pRiA4b ORF-3 family protein n=1 Tax=Streptomyces sp. H27-D2 TaxID=3046304 RepID=UPI002DB80FBF|nr:plasmid pRiA4b ORF-3 family protein [Streptomyces sp. H27-D2]MEC4014916.1 plasmid pRiA4b ORF-3 family protein [Streptomyces sp. H27-D2]